jgi:hypothetical protein
LEKILEGQLSELSVEPLPVVRETGWKFRNVASGADACRDPT